MRCLRLTLFVVLPSAIYCKLVAQYNDGDMEASNREVNSEGDQTDSDSDMVRDIIDYPDDEIVTADLHANSEEHQTQPVSGIVRHTVQSLTSIIRQINSNTSQSAPCVEEFILKSENLHAPENVILGRYRIKSGKYNGTYNNKVLYFHSTDQRTSRGFYMYWMSDLGGFWMIGTEPGNNYGVAHSRNCMNTACPASPVCQRKWSYYYMDDWIEDPSLMPDLEHICYCEVENGVSPDNGIMCGTYGNYEKKYWCNTDDICTGTTEPGTNAVSEDNRAQLCSNANGHWSIWNEWAQCSEDCDFGNQTRNRVCNNPAPAPGGKNCSYDGSSNTDSRMCYNKGCPIDCQWSGWTFGPCSKTCGSGERHKFRSKTVVEMHGGSCNGAVNATEVCNTDSCPVDSQCNGVPTTGWDCCSSKHPCGYGEGDCDTDEECKENFYCGMDICAIEFASNSSGWSIKADCCLPVPYGAVNTTTTTPATTTEMSTTTVGIPTTTSGGGLWISSAIDRWCTWSGRSSSRLATGVTEAECKALCGIGCKAVEYWTAGSKPCYECTNPSLITTYGNTNDGAYPPVVFEKN